MIPSMRGLAQQLDETGASPGDASDRRSEPRHEVVEAATLTFRGQPHPVAVMNISSRGTMIASDLAPRLGESVMIRFEGCSQMYAFVRWAREGRIGLNFGCELTLG